MTKSNRTLVFVLIAVVLVIGFFGLFKFSNKSATNPNASGNLASASFALFPNARNIQPFALQESNGASFNDHSLKGHWSLVFFGYTNCPDVCPTTLATMNKVWQTLPTNVRDQIEFIFVSVDPQRDTLDNLHKYVTYFNPHFVAVTGSDSQLEQLSRQVGVAYFKVEPASKAANYIINHTGSLMLFNPLGQYAGLFSPPFQTERLATDLQKIVHSR